MQTSMGRVQLRPDGTTTTGSISEATITNKCYFIVLDLKKGFEADGLANLVESAERAFSSPPEAVICISK